MLIPRCALAVGCAIAFTGPVGAQDDRPVRCKTPAALTGAAVKSLPPAPGVDGSEDCSYGSTNPSSRYATTSVFLVPVVFHVIMDGMGNGNLSAAQVQSQIDILNQDFRAKNGSGHDTGIEFYLATTDPSGQPTTGITFSTNSTWYQDQGEYYNSLAWDPHRYLNIYSNNGGGGLGYVPGVPQTGLVGQKTDRVVLLWSTVGRNAAYGAPFHMGRTATHELGHYLGLWHTFEGGCGTSSCYNTGDTLCDTNTEAGPHYGCTPSSSCASVDPIHNYMNYTDDQCMWEFTGEQSRRMRCVLEFWRPSLWMRCEAASVANRTSGANVPSYACSPPVLGASIEGALVPLTGHVASVVFGSTISTNQPLGNGYHLLVDLGRSSNSFVLPPVILPQSRFSLPVPNDPQLCGTTLYTQAAHLGGVPGLALSNAQDLTFGR